MTPEQYFHEHGITPSSLDKFGITSNKQKITIPIKDEDGEVLFNKYRFLEGDIKFSYDKGAEATIFNYASMKDSTYVFLVEGEPDCIRLDQEDIIAVSNTSGANTFKKEWVELFTGKKVYILYDTDKAGIEGAQRVLELIPHAIVITLPSGYKDVCEYFQEHSKADFKSLVKVQEDAQSISYEQLCAVFDKWLLLPDKNVIKVFLSVLVSHFLESDPVWMFFVAPPSGSKTEIISTATDLPFVKMLSDLTPNTFASGMKAKVDPSLLPQLKDNVLLMKDFTTVLSMRREDRASILAQLREIYDGKYSKAFGTGKKMEWEGRITLIAGVTPMIDTHSSVSQAMGERFIMYRIPQPDPEAVAKKALKGFGSEKKMREELKAALTKFFLSLEIPPIDEIELPEDIQNALSALSTFIVTARSAVLRDYKKEIEYIPEPEAPARLVKQLGSLIKSIAVICKRKIVTWEDYYLILHIALDVIPTNRTRHINALCDLVTRSQSTTEIANKTDYSTAGAANILEDLNAVKVLKVIRGGGGTTNEWMLSNNTKELFKKILPIKDKDIYKVFRQGNPYTRIIAEMMKEEEPTATQDQTETISEEEDAWSTYEQETQI